MRQNMPKPSIKHVQTEKIRALLSAYQAFLTDKGLKNTKQREIIVEEFFKQGAHISADDLFRTVQKTNKNIGLASVYRTLRSLVDSGLAVERRFLDRTSVFEYNDPSAHHDHFICMRCNQIIEFENKEIEVLQEEIAKRLGFRLVDHKLELYGICAKGDCAKRVRAGIRGSTKT